MYGDTVVGGVVVAGEYAEVSSTQPEVVMGTVACFDQIGFVLTEWELGFDAVVLYLFEASHAFVRCTQLVEAFALIGSGYSGG